MTYSFAIRNQSLPFRQTIHSSLILFLAHIVLVGLFYLNIGSVVVDIHQELRRRFLLMREVNRVPLEVPLLDQSQCIHGITSAYTGTIQRSFLKQKCLSR